MVRAIGTSAAAGRLRKIRTKELPLAFRRRKTTHFNGYGLRRPAASRGSVRAAAASRGEPLAGRISQTLAEKRYFLIVGFRSPAMEPLPALPWNGTARV